jgi:phospho-N-acetylmuramoyl-pentapeptide-transferase
MMAEYVDSITLRTIFSLVVSFCITLFLTPYVIKRLKEKQIGQTVREEGVKEHLKKTGVPTMGGITMIVSISVASLIWGKWITLLWLALFTLIFMGILGFCDDFSKFRHKQKGGLTAKQKLFFQILLGLGLGYYLYESEWITNSLFIPVLNQNLDLGWGYIVLVMLTIVGSSNAVNLTDGLDGLASGVLFIVTGCIGIVAYFSGNTIFSSHLSIPYMVNGGELTIVSFAMVGACLGFLWYNAFPAQVFMGDTGSLSLGGTLGVVAILCKAELFLVIIGGIFVIEALSVMIQVGSFKLRGKRVFKMAPIHHHFELLGWKETKVVIRFWIITLVLALIGMAFLGLNGRIFYPSANQTIASNISTGLLSQMK